MKKTQVKGAAGVSTVIVGERLGNLAAYLPSDRQIVLITDHTVHDCYGALFPPGPVIKIGTGETIKTLDTVRDIYEQCLELDLDRSAFIVGIGGGIVCDITGFAASTFLRGLDFGFVATTLLSQVDASVGGKNGVNLKGYKNLVGVFNQPEFVICDFNLLKTLSKSDLACGFAEIVKHAAIADADLFAYLEENCEKALALDLSVIEKLVADSVVIKAGVVSRDETEKGERRKLNFGHTFGHGIEKLTGVAHGEAVSVGVALASDLSVRLGMLAAESFRRICHLLERYGLPVEIMVSETELIRVLRRDKKRLGDVIHFVLLDRIGHAVVRPLSLNDPVFRPSLKTKAGPR